MLLNNIKLGSNTWKPILGESTGKINGKQSVLEDTSRVCSHLLVGSPRGNSAQPYVCDMVMSVALMRADLANQIQSNRAALYGSGVMLHHSTTPNSPTSPRPKGQSLLTAVKAANGRRLVWAHYFPPIPYRSKAVGNGVQMP